MDEKNMLAAILTLAYYTGTNRHSMTREQIVIDYLEFLKLLDKTDGNQES